MTAIATSPFNLSMLRKANTWYTVKDGNWSDPTTWQSNGAKKYNLPLTTDTVYINHNVNIDAAIPGASSNLVKIDSLYGTGYLKWTTSNLNLTIGTTLNFQGTIDHGSTSATTLQLNGVVNILSNYIHQNVGTVVYNGVLDQLIIDLTYNNVTVQNLSTKTILSNLNVVNNLSVNDGATLETLSYNVVTGGACVTSGYPRVATFQSSGGGAHIFGGLFSIANNLSQLNISGNPTMEFRGGLNCKVDATGYNWGNGNISFTSNNQTITYDGNLSQNSTYPVTINQNITIVGPITITNNGKWIRFNGTINGTAGGSTLINNGQIVFGSGAVQMSTGTFIYNNAVTSGIGYAFNGDFVLPFSNYAFVMTDGTGTKQLSSSATMTNLQVGNGTIGGTFVLSSNTSLSGNINILYSTFECGTYDLTTNGNVTITNNSYVISAFSKTGSGNLIFGGLFKVVAQNCMVSLTGNPSIEFRGGCYFKRDGIYNWGNGDIRFTTNNQIISGETPDDSHFTISGNITIIGAITVTNQISMFILTGILNGTTSESTFSSSGIFRYQNQQQPMQIGLLSLNTATNTFYYNLNGAQNITTGTYKNLTLSSGGIKTLLGNVSILNTYSLLGTASVNSNGFALTNP